MARKTGLVSDFAKVIGSRKLPTFGGSGHINPGYSQVAVDIARHLNPRLELSQQRFVRQVFERKLAKKKGERFSYLSDTTRQELLARCMDSNRKLAERYFDGDMEKLFRAPVPSDKRAETLATVDPVAVADIIADIMVQVDIRDERSAAARFIGRYPSLVAKFSYSLRRWPRLKTALRKIVKV